MNKSQFVKQATKDLATFKRKSYFRTISMPTAKIALSEVEKYEKQTHRNNRKMYSFEDKRRDRIQNTERVGAL